MTLGVAVLAAMVIGTAAWKKPDLILQVVRVILPAEIRSSFSVENITGNPKSGYQLENVGLHFSSRTVLIDSLKFNITWLPLIDRKSVV